MTIMRHEVTYQGKPCVKLQFSRSVGLSPDKGSVEINLEDLGKIRLYPYEVRFRSTNDLAYESGLPISAFLKLKGTTTTARPPLEGRAEGLNEFGELVLRTYSDGNPAKIVSYHDIFVDTSGLEEVTDDLANVLDHNEGVVRVPLTDIRQFYAGRAPLYQRINYHVASGKYDPESIHYDNVSDSLTSLKRKNGKPFTASQVFRFLFSQLPGSPPCLTNLGANLSNFEDPQDIVGGGQPVVEVIQRLLDQNGLEACFQPDGSYVLNYKTVDKDLGSKVPTEPGKLSDIPYVHYEKKTHSISTHPAIVEVIGKKKVRQSRTPYRAVIKDLDGVWRDIDDIEDLWKYEKGSIAKQTLTSSDKSFDDVPPGDKAKGDQAILYHRRRELLRDQAYKVYAPGWLIFGEKIKPAYGGPEKYGFREDDVDAYPTLPITELPLYKKQFKDLYKQIPRPVDVPEADEVVWVPPVVSGSYNTSGMFKDFEAVEKRWKSLLATEKEWLKEGNDALKQAKKKAQKWKKQQGLWVDSIDQNKLYGSNLLTGLVQSIREATGIGPTELTDHDEFADEATAYLEKARAATQENIKLYQKWVTEGTKALKQRATNFATLKRVYKKFGVVWLKYNVPHQVLSGGYAIDRKTGIIKFSKPMFVSIKPFYLDSETEEISRPAEIEVLYGYESNMNTKGDYTTVQVGGDPDGAVDVLAVQALAAIPPYIMRAPSLRFAQEETGTPMNAETIKNAALDMAKPMLSQPRDATGYDRQYIGLWKVVLDMGVSMVTHDFDGDVAYTHVAINAPSAFHSGGFANMKPKASSIGDSVVAHIAAIGG